MGLIKSKLLRTRNWNWKKRGKMYKRSVGFFFWSAGQQRYMVQLRVVDIYLSSKVLPCFLNNNCKDITNLSTSIPTQIKKKKCIQKVLLLLFY